MTIEPTAPKTPARTPKPGTDATAAAPRRHQGTRIVAALALFTAIAVGTARPASADLFDWLHAGAEQVKNAGIEISDALDDCVLGCSINQEGGAKPCAVVAAVGGAANEVPTKLRFRVGDHSGITEHQTKVAHATITIDGVASTTSAGPSTGEFSASRAFSATQAGNHRLRVSLAMKAGYTCTSEADIWVHPKSWLTVSAQPDPANAKRFAVHAGLHADWEDMTGAATYTWSFGGGKPVGGPTPWNVYGSNVVLDYAKPGPKTVTVTATVASRGRLVTRSRSLVVVVDGAQADVIVPVATSGGVDDSANDGPIGGTDPIPVAITPGATAAADTAVTDPTLADPTAVGPTDVDPTAFDPTDDLEGPTPAHDDGAATLEPPDRTVDPPDGAVPVTCREDSDSRSGARRHGSLDSRDSADGALGSCA